MKNNVLNQIVKTLGDGNILHYSWYEAMHTRIDILLHGVNIEELKELSVKIHALIFKLELITDRFNVNSEIFRVNMAAYKMPVEISDCLFEILSDCLNANIKTNGLFDITINSPNHNIDSINTVKIDFLQRTVRLMDSQTILDLNGYTKGYALDKIKDLIAETSVQNALINLGNSSILGIGNHPFGKGWKIGGQDLLVPDVTLFNECLTTSGNVFDDRKHIKHPLSHEYILRSKTISVKTQLGTLGEILSTSLLLATKEQQVEILKKFMISEDNLVQFSN